MFLFQIGRMTSIGLIIASEILSIIKRETLS